MVKSIAYINKKNTGTMKMSLPVPDSSGMSQGMGVNFDELGKELDRIKKDFEGEWLKVSVILIRRI